MPGDRGSRSIVAQRKPKPEAVRQFLCVACESPRNKHETAPATTAQGRVEGTRTDPLCEMAPDGTRRHSFSYLSAAPMNLPIRWKQSQSEKTAR
jgi:hypothetical protein